MAKVQIKLNKAGISEILKSQGAEKVCMEYAGQVLGRLSDGYEVETRVTDRAVVVVYAATPKARNECLRNNTLLKAGGI